MTSRKIVLALTALLATVLSGVSARAAEKVKVVASFSILADLVKQVGGEHVDVVALVGPNADMHIFQPTPSHSKLLLDARLVVINGLGLEGWADRLVKASGYRGARLVASKGVKALAGSGEHGRYDPHAWQEVANVKVYVANIRDALAEVDPADKADYDRAADNYLRELQELESEITVTFAGMPASQRRVITTHEAFTYFGDAYGIEFLAAQGVSGDTAPSAKDVARLIRQIKQEKVTAIFVENISGTRLMDRISRETGATIGGTLYSDALSDPSGPAPTYLDMMRHNVRLIGEALRKGT